jgi:phosphohistidine phosphatase
MRRLLLLRHAKSSWSDPELTDHDRPLSRRGERDIRRLAKHLANEGLSVDLILCSTATRTRQTIAELKRRMPDLPEPQFQPELYLPTPPDLFSMLRELPAELDTVLVVGHSPSLDALALAFLPPDAIEVASRLTEKLPTSSLVTLNFEPGAAQVWGPDWEGSWQAVTATAVTLLTPHDLTKKPAKPRRVKKAPEIELPADATTAEGFATALAAYLPRIRENAAGIQADLGPEYVHQFRVGLRRLRVAFRWYGDLLEENVREPTIAELRWIFQVMGPLHDLDVFLQDVLGPMLDDPELAQQAPLETLADALNDARRHARDSAKDALRSPRYSVLIQTLTTLQAKLDGDTTDDSPPLRDWARRRLKRRIRKLTAVGSLSDMPAETLHEHRKNLKKLRYAADLAPGALPKRYRKRLAKLDKQRDIIGAMHDYEVALDKLAQLACSISDDEIEQAAVTPIARRLEASAKRARKRLKRIR